MVMNVSVNKVEEFRNINGGIIGMGEHMGEWECPKDVINPKEGQKPPQTCTSASSQTQSLNLGMRECTKIVYHQ